MNENLKKIRLTLGYSQQEIADKLNININTYRGYEYNKREMPYEILKFLIDKFSININWLLTSEGNMFSSKNKTINENNLINIQISAIGKRLNEIQLKNNYKDGDMSKLLGIYEYEYNELKLGEKEPNLKILNLLKQKFGISIDWILYGN